MCRNKHKAMRNMKTLGNMIQPKDQNKSQVTNPQEMGIYEQSDKEFKILKEAE